MWELTNNRVIAAGAAVCLLVYARWQIGTGEHFWRTGGYILFCLGLIWFGPALARYTGPFGRHYIDSPTPEILVTSIGWLLLLLTLLLIAGADGNGLVR